MDELTDFRLIVLAYTVAGHSECRIPGYTDEDIRWIRRALRMYSGQLFD